MIAADMRTIVAGVREITEKNASRVWMIDRTVRNDREV